MRNLICLFVLALAFTGCSTEDDANVPDGLLKRVRILPFTGNEITKRYYYEGYQLDRIESSDDSREIYVYDGDLIVNIKNYEDTDLVKEQQFQYNDSNQLAQTLNIDYENNHRYKLAYAYNADGTVTSTHYAIDAAGLETIGAIRQFFFTNGEVTQDVITHVGGIIQTNTYTYDDKLVPEHGIVGLDKIRMFNPESYKGIYHNIVSVTQTNSANADVGTYMHVWEYNADGAPSYFTFDDDGTIIIDAGTWQYFYK